jgi:hypothetical protein
VSGEQPSDVVGAGRELDPAHGSTAARAAVEVGEEDMFEHPSPTLAACGVKDARRPAAF